MASSASEQSVAAATTRAPLIGVTTYQEQARSGVWDTEFALLHYAYVDMVVRAGGVPVLLPPQEGGAAEVVERLDGLILSGGADVAPRLYGAQPHARTTVVRPGRDDWEMRLLRQALAADLPLLGVCRGLELMNVALGGTLRQHLPDILGHEGHCPAPGVFGEVRVALRAGSAVPRAGPGDRRPLPSPSGPGRDRTGTAGRRRGRRRNRRGGRAARAPLRARRAVAPRTGRRRPEVVRSLGRGRRREELGWGPWPSR